MNVHTGDGIAEALEFAKKYEPCMVFYEDVDQVMGDERDEKINLILNTVDGILSKTSRVMTILTSNHADRIQQAMTRPGRIDGFIEMGRVDDTSLGKLIEAYSGDDLAEAPNVGMLMPLAEGYTPSFIGEACNRAILYAMSRNDSSGTEIGLTNQDLKAALEGLRSQYELMVANRDGKGPSLETLLTGVVQNAVKGEVNCSEPPDDTCPQCGEVHECG
jgi:transitional endoplasmic reticulum ATPase